MTDAPKRRESDQLVRPMFYAGLFCFAVAALFGAIVLLKGVTVTWILAAFIGFFLLIGALLMPTERVVRGLRIWRRGNGNGTGEHRTP